MQIDRKRRIIAMLFSLCGLAIISFGASPWPSASWLSALRAIFVINEIIPIGFVAWFMVTHTFCSYHERENWMIISLAVVLVCLIAIAIQPRQLWHMIPAGIAVLAFYQSFRLGRASK